MQVVTDNLVHRGLIPPMVHVLVSPSTGGEEQNVPELPEEVTGSLRGMRVLQYCTPSERYGRHLIDEVLSDAGKSVKLRADGYSRGSAGISGGATCAFILAWFHPDQFSRVHGVVGGIPVAGPSLSELVRRGLKRNMRVWLQGSSNDIDGDDLRFVFLRGGLPLNNVLLANALKLRGYDFFFRFGDGYHSLAQAGLDLPESLPWLWRGYDPDRTEQRYEQDDAERNEPVFRVQIANRRA